MGKNELKTLQIINAAWTSVCYTQNFSIPKYCCAQSHSHEYSSAAILYSLERSQQNGKQNEIDQIRTIFQISFNNGIRLEAREILQRKFVTESHTLHFHFL